MLSLSPKYIAMKLINLPNISQTPTLFNIRCEVPWGLKRWASYISWLHVACTWLGIKCVRKHMVEKHEMFLNILSTDGNIMPFLL